MLGREIYFPVFVDSQGALDSVVSLKLYTERPLLIDIATLRQTHQEGELRHFACIATNVHPVDALTKKAPCNCFVQVQRTCRLIHSV